MTEVQPSPPPHGNPSPGGSAGNESWSGRVTLLQPIGVFLGTYGLAVFLVLYYTIKIYPSAQEERREWLQEVTNLEQALREETRSLTADQAKHAIALATHSYFAGLRRFAENELSARRLD